MVGLVECAQSVRDDQGSAVGRRCEERFHEAVRGGGVEVFGCLIDRQDRSGSRKGASHEQAATLASRHRRSTGADDRVDPVRQRLDPFIEACPREQLRGLVAGERCAGDAQVLVDGGREDVGVLGRHRDVVGELIAVRSPRGDTVNESGSRLGRDHARERRQQRGLPDAGGSHDGQGRTRTQRERDAGGQRRTTRPADGQVACLDNGWTLRDVVGFGGSLVVQEGADAGRSLGASHQLRSGGG